MPVLSNVASRPSREEAEHLPSHEGRREEIHQGAGWQPGREGASEPDHDNHPEPERNEAHCWIRRAGRGQYSRDQHERHAEPVHDGKAQPPTQHVRNQEHETQQQQGVGPGGRRAGRWGRSFVERCREESADENEDSGALGPDHSHQRDQPSRGQCAEQQDRAFPSGEQCQARDHDGGDGDNQDTLGPGGGSRPGPRHLLSHREVPSVRVRHSAAGDGSLIAPSARPRPNPGC